MFFFAYLHVTTSLRRLLLAWFHWSRQCLLDATDDCLFAFIRRVAAQSTVNCRRVRQEFATCERSERGLILTSWPAGQRSLPAAHARCTTRKWSLAGCFGQIELNPPQLTPLTQLRALAYPSDSVSLWVHLEVPVHSRQRDGPMMTQSDPGRKW